MEPTTQCEVLKIINSLPSKKSSGYDGISNVVLKEIRTNCTKPINNNVQHVTNPRYLSRLHETSRNNSIAQI